MHGHEVGIALVLVLAKMAPALILHHGAVVYSVGFSGLLCLRLLCTECLHWVNSSWKRAEFKSGNHAMFILDEPEPLQVSLL